MSIFQMATPKLKECISKTGLNLVICLMLISALGCSGTMPTLGGSKGTVSGGAAGANSQGKNKDLAHCDETLGTLRLYEDRSLEWWGHYRRLYPSLGTTIPVIRMMVQQSNCFAIVERGGAMSAMNQERALMNSGELRNGSNFGKGQMVAADYTLSPSIQFSKKKSGGLGGFFSGVTRKLGSAGKLLGAGGGLSANEAATTLLLIENRSGVQVSAAVGSAKNFDFSFAGFPLGGGGFGGVGGYTDTPEGKVIIAAFADSYNQMVKALRNYRAQAVKGGLGKGGRLKVGGADDPMPVATEKSDVTHVNPVTVTQAPPVTHVVHHDNVTVSSHADNISIEAYDEDALEDYYDALKSAVKVMSTFSSITAEQAKSMEKRQGFGVGWWNVWSGAVSGQLETAKIELESWPLSAKREGWRILGRKIVQYNKLFNKHRKLITVNDALEERLRFSVRDFELVTKASLLGGG